jgi:hypothetical protein
MIYDRAGVPVTIRRRAILSDIKRLDHRTPDKFDRQALRAGSYVVVNFDGLERIHHVSFLCADGGPKEIADAIAAAERKVAVAS